MFCIIRQLYPILNKKIDAMENPTVVKIGKIRNCIATTNEINRLRLQSDPSQASNFESLIFDGDIDFSEYEKPTNKEIELDPKHRYQNTAVIFCEHLEDIGEF